MIDYLAANIADFLFENKAVEENERDICRYGIEVILANAVGVILILIISLILNRVVYGVIFLVLYSTLRIYTGGYHAKTYFKCNTYFIITFLLTLIASTLLYGQMGSIVLWGLVIMGFGVVADYSPIKNKNRKLSCLNQKKYKKNSIFIYAFLMAAMLITDILCLFCDEINIYLADYSLYIKNVIISIVLLMILGLHDNASGD